MHKDAITKGQKVVIVDDVLATGGTIEAVANIILLLKIVMKNMLLIRFAHIFMIFQMNLTDSIMRLKLFLKKIRQNRLDGLSF